MDSEPELQTDIAFYQQLLDTLFDGVYFVDPQRRIIYWNQGAERISGYQRDEVIGRPCYDQMLNHTNEQGQVMCQVGCPLAETMRDGRQREVHAYLHHREGHRVPVVIRALPMKDKDGRIIGAIESFSDNSQLVETIRKMEELHQTALTDSLTGLGNRRLSEIKLQTYLAESSHTGRPFGVLFFDIDHFKRINDQYGHQVGDEVLRMTANTMRLSMRTSDFLGRWGGEEMIALFHDMSTPHLARVAENLRAQVSHSRLQRANDNISVTVSIGATLSRSGDSLHTIIERADELMYRSKQAGRNRVTME